MKSFIQNFHRISVRSHLLRYNHSWVPDDLVDFVQGRGRQERKDSVTIQILQERKQHHELMIQKLPTDSLVKHLESEGFGKKSRISGVYSTASGTVALDTANAAKTLTGAGGFAQHLGSASRNWPIFKHLLPEIALAGHSNSGKSTLVNALVGVLPRFGPAKVSDRAGWTDQLCFYQLGKRPPILTMVDLPGYGHAVATTQDKIAWNEMMKDFLSTRKVLSRCCILIDSTRGLCAQDKKLLRYLNKVGVSWTVVATKADLLSSPALAQSLLVIEEDLQHFLPRHRVRSHTHSLSSIENEEDEYEDVEVENEEDDEEETEEDRNEIQYEDNTRPTMINTIRNKDNTLLSSLSSPAVEPAAKTKNLDDITTENTVMEDEDEFVGTHMVENQEDDEEEDEKDLPPEDNHQEMHENSPTEESFNLNASSNDLNVKLLYQRLWPVSASTGAGINTLWSAMKQWAEQDAIPYINERSVRDHKDAKILKVLPRLTTHGSKSGPKQGSSYRGRNRNHSQQEEKKRKIVLSGREKRRLR